MDLTAGVRIGDLRDGGVLRGTVGKEAVVLVRKGERVFAVGARCTHYHGALEEGLVVGDTLRCPLHHACFDLATGEALRAPALDPIPCWNVERRGEMVFVRDKMQPIARLTDSPRGHPSSVVIVGGGAAGLAAADMLRRQKYSGPITMFSAEADPPIDRPNLSKDYLAGEAHDDWMPLWSQDTYAERQVKLLVGTQVASIDPVAHTISLANGAQEPFAALLLATGAEPVHLSIPGADGKSVFYLRSFADCRAIIERAESATRVVVVGASFIGLEVAASLRTRGIAVDVVAPDRQPLERVLGAEIGRFVRKLHESHGVTFHLGETVSSMSGRTVQLSGGDTLEADFIVLGVGVRPAVELAQRSGLAIDRGVLVDEFLETSAPGIYAAGDIARWPDTHSGERIRVEHWVVAMRQGQTAAQNMLGARVRFDAVPYFWSQHYDVTIRYVGHAERWDELRIDGSLDQRDATASFLSGGRRVAAATVSRDRASLEIEVALETMRAPISSSVANSI
jgi:NADPH-dependent 2,4-dienoyl-CoA reductase/sulfur reductase-like enzyme/nitrite reductase/ring-hydroxylating ferredoxin subunit